MNYWMAIRWPQYRDEDENVENRYWIYIPEDKKELGQDVGIGDLIFFYETKTGWQLAGKAYNYKAGKQGIIAIVKAISKLEPEKVREEYEYKPTVLWGWRIRTKLYKKCSVKREDICEIFGYSQNYFFRGFGSLRKLYKDQFEAIRSKCK